MPRRDLIAVGASAGGVAALRRLAADLPPRLPAAVLLVLHVGGHASILPMLLDAAGPLPARHPVEGEAPEAGTLYVAPPDHHLVLVEGRLRLLRTAREHHTRPAIDPLFRSVAIEAGPRVVGVVLTGLNEDGAAGLLAIRECGGIAMVQDPEDAEEPTMPAAALRIAVPQHVLPLDAIGPKLVELVGRPVEADAPVPPARWVHEHRASAGDAHAIAELGHLGAPTTLACPECGGVLWELPGPGEPRFRCHTGHAYGLGSLAQAHAGATEAALRTAVRALHEKEMLLRRMADVDRLAGDVTRATRAEQEAEAMRAKGEVLRRLAAST